MAAGRVAGTHKIRVKRTAKGDVGFRDRVRPRQGVQGYVTGTGCLNMYFEDCITRTVWHG